MKKIIITALALVCLVGCKTKKANGTFDIDVTYIGYAESHGADIIPGDVPVPSSITFKL